MAVVGRADERLGEKIVAFVERAAGSEIDAAALRPFCLGRLARSKVPDQFVMVEEMPRNAMGKVIKGALRWPAPPASGRSLPG